MEGTRKIAVWPDHIWCDRDEIEDFMNTVGISDDFAIVNVPEELNEDDINTLITNHFSGAFTKGPLKGVWRTHVKAEELNDITHAYVRISDNVLDEGDWAEYALYINDNVVIAQSIIKPGCYTIGSMVDWTMAEVAQWSQFNDTGSHPENYHEIKLPKPL